MDLGLNRDLGPGTFNTMAKKSTKTTEELTEEFFALERTEYEKRVPAAFPRVAVKAVNEPAELPVEDNPLPPEPPELVEDEKPEKAGLKA